MNHHRQSGRTLLNHHVAARGLIVTLNKNLMNFLKEALRADYKEGPWMDLVPDMVKSDREAFTSEMFRTIDVLSIEGIIRNLDGSEAGDDLTIYDLREIKHRLWDEKFLTNYREIAEIKPLYSWETASRDLSNMFYDPLYGNFKDLSQGDFPEDEFLTQRRQWY